MKILLLIIILTALLCVDGFRVRRKPAAAAAPEADTPPAAAETPAEAADTPPAAAATPPAAAATPPAAAGTPPAAAGTPPAKGGKPPAGGGNDTDTDTDSSSALQCIKCASADECNKERSATMDCGSEKLSSLSFGKKEKEIWDKLITKNPKSDSGFSKCFTVQNKDGPTEFRGCGTATICEDIKEAVPDLSDLTCKACDGPSCNNDTAISSATNFITSNQHILLRCFFITVTLKIFI